MDTLLAQLGPALVLVFNPVTLGLIAAGVVLGTIFGILPGFGGAQALALIFPFTLLLDPAQAIVFMLSVYSAAEYGGSIPAILIRTPGTAAAVMTILDGAPMADAGKPLRALTISLTSGVVGGVLSTLVFVVAASALAWVGLLFGPGEMFAVGVFGLAIIGGFVGRDPIKAFLAATIGLLLATVGDSSFGGTRFYFDQAFLYDGVPLIVMITAMLAAPEAIRLLMRTGERDAAKPIPIDLGGADRLELRGFLRLWKSMLRGSLIGTAIGALPGPGPTVASVIAYNEEKRWSREPQRFGKGAEEGIAAPEAANNAVVAGALVPALALGIPGSGAIAILLGMLVSKGVVPGPTLFSDGGPLVAATFIGLLVCNVMMLVIGLVGLRLFVPITKVPAGVLGPFILTLLVVGVYAYDNSLSHVLMFLVLGTLAWLLERFGVSTLPLILGFVMGPIIENNLGRALIINNGDLWTVVSAPITASLLGVALITAVWSYVRTVRAEAEAAP